MIVVLSNLDNQDYPAFWPTQAGAPIVWESGYSSCSLSVVTQDDFLPRSDYIREPVS